MTDMQNVPQYAVDLDQIRAYIRSLMAERKMTVAKLADKTGITKGTLDNFFDGTTKAPSFDKVCTMIIALDGSVDEALGIWHPAPVLAAPAMDFTALSAAHQLEMEAKDDHITDLRNALAMERKKIKRMMWWQRLFLIENIILVLVFVLDFYNHDWGYFRGSLLNMLFNPAGGKTTIFKG